MRRLFLRALERSASSGAFAFVFADGERFEQGAAPWEFVAHFKTEAALADCVRRGSLGFGEAYMQGNIEVEGDLQHLVRVGQAMAHSGFRPGFLEIARFVLGSLLRRNTLSGSRRNIATHYDLGNDFYARFLDPQMQYTCAYFEVPEDSLEQAQLNKMDLVCRKLGLKPGQEIVEAGCGWGGLALHAATHYGVRVTSYNISKEQIAWARERALALGVGPEQVEYRLEDYRSIPKLGKRFDHFVSVGMLEHVGRENYRRFFDLIHRVTRPEGRALVHSIGRSYPSRIDAWLERYIFPGAYIPSLGEITASLESPGRLWQVSDVENLRLHYAVTLDHWAARLEAHVAEIVEQHGEEFVRMFRLYLRSAAAGFRWGGLQLYQLVLEMQPGDGPPCTRHAMLHHEAAGKPLLAPVRKAPAPYER